MRRHSLFLASLMVLTGACAFAQQTFFQYRVSKQVEREIGEPGGGWASLQPQPPAGFAETPALAAPKPFYGRALGGRSVILDKSSPDAKYYDLLWLDRNNNKKFEAEEKFALKPAADTQDGGTLIPISFDAEDGPVQQHFLVVGIVRETNAHLSYRNAGYCIGKVKFGDRVHLVALVDHNANGTFNDPTTQGAVGDYVLIDFNDDGRFENQYQQQGEVATIGKYLGVDGVFYAAAIASDGSSITLTRPDVQTGKLQVDEPLVALTVIGDNGKYTLNRTKGNDPFLLPAGSYSVKMAVLTRQNKDGSNWAFRTEEGTGAAFDISPGKEASLKVSGPVTASVSIQKANGGADFDLTLHIEGLPPGKFQKDGSEYNVATPNLLAKAKEGTWQKRYAFAFG